MAEPYPIQSRRTHLQGISVRACDHAGLWLDKFIDRESEEKTEKAEIYSF